MTPVPPVLGTDAATRREMTVLMAVRLMAGLLLRRFVNRLSSGLGKKKNAPRSGTGRKRPGGVAIMLFLAALMAWNSFVLTGQALNALGEAVGPARDEQGRVEIDRRVYRQLLLLEGLGEGDRGRVMEQALASGHVPRESVRREEWRRLVRTQYRERGIDGFTPVEPNAGMPVPKLRQWGMPESGALLSRAIGALLLLLAATRYCTTLGSTNQDLGQVDWSAEWFFTLPLPARHFFAAQIFGHALIDPFSWIVTLPFLLALFISAGLGWWAVAAALIGTAYLAVVMASLRVLTETWLRKRLPPARLKNLQAVFTVLGMSLFFVLLVGCRAGPAMPWLVGVIKEGAGWLVMTPFALPAAFCGAGPVLAIVAQCAVAAGVFIAAVRGCAWLVRDGLVTASGAYAGRRGAAPASGRFIPAGIIGKDVLLLLRDRNFFVQALVVPVVLVGFQFFFNGGLAHSVGSSFQHAAAFAYGVGAYALTSTALGVLSVEGNALWMLYAFPVPLHRIMLRKTVLWAGCALGYTLVALIVCAFAAKTLEPVDVAYACLACAGVVIHAFIAAGLGMLGTDPLETEVRRRLRVGTVYLYMVLAGMFGYAIYAPSWWTQAGQLVLSCLLAYALWQKVGDNAPFLLDPVSRPPPRVSLADGLIAALAFFVLQGLVSLFAVFVFKAPTGPALTIAFGLAGALVAFFVLHAFWRRRVPHLAEELGLAAPLEQGGRWNGVAVGLVAGVVAGVVGLLYLAVLAGVPWLRSWRDEALAVHSLEAGWLVAITLVAAPVFEEFIFRGVVFRGMRRSLSVGASIFASAGVFALCHPPVSVVPVFVMAVLAAWSFERTKWLVSPIIVHAVYNGMVLLGNAIMG